MTCEEKRIQNNWTQKQFEECVQKNLPDLSEANEKAKKFNEGKEQGKIAGLIEKGIDKVKETVDTVELGLNILSGASESYAKSNKLNNLKNIKITSESYADAESDEFYNPEFLKSLGQNMSTNDINNLRIEENAIFADLGFQIAKDRNKDNPDYVPSTMDIWNESRRLKILAAQDASGEDATILENLAGKNAATNLIGDLYRATEQGYEMPASLETSLQIFDQGTESDGKLLEKFIEEQKALTEANNSSDEMKAFEKCYADAGGTTLALVKCSFQNPSVLTQLAVNSAALNAGAVTQSATVRNNALAAGAVGSAGGPAAAMAGFFGVAGGLLETGLTFGELLIEATGVEDISKLTVEDLQKVLNDPEKLKDIQTKSRNRGIVIGVAGGLSSGAAAKATSTLVKAGKSAKLAGTVGASIEMVGEGLGEAGGQLAAGQSLDQKEIFFEMVAPLGSKAPISVGGTLLNLNQLSTNIKVNNTVKANGFGKLSDVFKPGVKTDKTQIDIAQIPNAEKTLDLSLEQQMNSKAITPQQAQEIKIQFKETKAVVNQIKPLGLSTEKQSLVVNLLKEKKNLESTINQVNDESLTGKQSERVNEINEELKNVGEQETQKSVTKEAQGKKGQEIDNLAGQKNEDGKYEVTKAEWDGGKADEVITEIYNNDMLTGLIESKIPIEKPPGFSKPDFVSGVVAELIPHIRNFNPEVNNSLNGWIMSQINNKVGNVFKKGEAGTKQVFETDVTEAKGVTDGTDVNVQIQEDLDISPRTAEQKASVTKLRDIAGITTEEAQVGVTETLKTRLPGVTEKKFRQKVNEANRLKFGEKVLAEMGGLKDAGRLVTFLDTNFNDIMAAIPNSVKNKQLASLFKPKQVGRAKTKVGEGVFEYTMPTKQELIDFYTTGKNTTNRARVKTLADVIAQELALDATAEVLADPKVQKEFIERQELQGKQIPKDAIPKLLEAIDRETKKFEGTLLMGIPPQLLGKALKGGIKAFQKAINAGKSIIQALAEFNKKISSLIKNSELAKIINNIFADNIINDKKLSAAEIIANAQTAFAVVNGDVNAVLAKHGLGKSYNLKTKSGIENYISDLKEFVFPFFPKSFFFGTGKGKVFGPGGGTILRTSSRMAGKDLDAFYVEQLKDVRDNYDNWGSDFTSVDNLIQVPYTTILKDVKTLESNLGKPINDWNTKNMAIGKEMWDRINKAIKKDKKAAVALAGYLKLVGNDVNHPHKMMAELLGYSNKPIEGLRYEHAMPATQAYIYLLDAALSGNKDFSTEFKNVTDNYKLIALDVKDDNKINKVVYNGKKAYLKERMPPGWIVETGKWYDRYFNNLVSKINGGINPASIKMLDGTTMADVNNLTNEGRPEAFISEKIEKASDVVEKGEEALAKNPDLQPTITDPEVLDKDINQMIEDTKGIKSKYRYSDIVAKRKGASVINFKLIPASAQDFQGLMYDLYSRGKKGEKQQKWVQDNLVKPYQKGIADIDNYRQALKNDYSALLKKFPNVSNKLGDIIPGTEFTLDQALRVNLWTQGGFEIPGLSKRDIKKLNDFVEKNPELKLFNESALAITKQSKWVEPTPHWDIESLISDLNGLTTRVGRKQFLAEFIANSDVIFSKENLNKMEVALGTNWREAMEDSLYRMKNGTNRPSGTNKLTNQFNNWVNNSVGAIMFMNVKSALLQTISSVNFLNWSDNNPYKAALALANFPQYVKDFKFLWNSPKLVQRRSGLRKDINEAELANAAKNAKNKPAAMLSYLLKLGFTPTQLADSFAIASGGATFYRNRLNTYKKQGLSEQEASDKAFADFSAASDVAQQSADPMLISQQQASVLGRLLLAFQNTPAQVTRIFNKASRDFINVRGDQKTNLSKMIYYGAVQGFIFAALQNAAFALIPGFDDEDDEEKKGKEFDKKEERILNSMVDTMLRGSGVYGAIVSTLKNTALTYYREEKKDAFGKDHRNTLLEILNLSPPVGSKVRKINNAIKAKDYNKEVVKEQGWDVTLKGRVNLSPSYQVIASLTEAITNLPLERAVVEIDRIVEMLDARNTTLQRVALALGYRTWDVNTKNEERDLVKIEAKEAKEKARKQKVIDDRAERKRLKEIEKYKGKTKEEIKQIKRRDSIVDTNKSDQVKSLINLGLTKKEIKELKYEDDRVNKIIELTNK